jgi:hypothetical protein
MFVGITLFGFFTAVISTWLASGRRKREGLSETQKIIKLEARLSSQLDEIRTEMRALRLKESEETKNNKATVINVSS